MGPSFDQIHSNIEKNSLISFLSSDELNERIEELREICGKIDPFSPLSKNEQKKLTALGIEEIENPFSITNQLVLLLEEHQEELQKREELSSKKKH